ncbi:MAG: YbaB/EbfC family nucleoid-associated protein [Roseitalea porphyridii]|uniref:Nucleoid-associated protein E0E05_03410 n=1 Tax=Roseitalea porphyridii TaxID=1852022 RepID=A0A4P6UZG4_9HYPH|nr:YbaB/EbfC family nucleoid-associated protein [Roseitalea porphyridii]QBK29729.1 YbaB/EbfC family nucleoid-associated protein [Roseitalea porphyridii]
MRDIMGLMSKAKEMQEKMQAMQAEIETMTADGTAGGGMVTVTLNGKGQMQAIKIDPSVFSEDDVEILEDLVIAAHGDAKTKIEQLVQEKTQEVTAGLPLPPGMKLPF